MTKSTLWLPLCLALAGACGGQTAQAPTDGGSAGEGSVHEDAPGDSPGQEGTDGDADGGTDALWGPTGRTCPELACVPSDDYFPAIPLMRSTDIGPDVTFLKVSQSHVLAVTDTGDVLSARFPLAPGEPLIVSTLPSASMLRPKDIASSPWVPAHHGVLACDEGCHVFVPSEQDENVLVEHAAGKVPLPGESDVLLRHVTPEQGEFFCVLGDGAACIRNDTWEIWVKPGTGPRLRDMAVGTERTVVVGDGGRWVTFEGGLQGGSPVEGWLEPARSAALVTLRFWDTFLAVRNELPPTIWNVASDHTWSCEVPSLPQVLAMREVNGVLHGVHAGGYPFKETLVEDAWTWVDACPPDGAPFHGELVDADVLLCGAGLNYIGLQSKAVLGTVHCPMEH